MSMFKCKACDAIDNFSLMLSADYQGPGKFSQTKNEHGEILINVDGFEFIPDLAFMNNFAVCGFCGEINNFVYHFEKEEEDNEKLPKPKDKKEKEDKTSLNVEKMPKKRKK